MTSNSSSAGAAASPVDANQASSATSSVVSSPSAVSPTPNGAPKSTQDELNEHFARMLEEVGPKGIAASSMGKYDEIRAWLASQLSISDWKRDTYATGASTTAHNFGSRWSQSNQVSGRHVPLGIGVVQVKPTPGEEEKAITEVLQSVADTSKKFIDGTRPTSYECMLICVQKNAEKEATARQILAVKDSHLAQELEKLFPGVPVVEIERAAGTKDHHEEKAGSLYSETLSPSTTAVAIDGSFLDTALSDLKGAGYRGGDGLLKSFILSLLAKPFVILAGQSGSGKTQIAKAFAKWIVGDQRQIAMVAVGADWTSNENVIGYLDALQPERYVATAISELLIRAHNNRNLPFFLILDEMNLSHVERYFADFLSALESGEPIALHWGDSSKCSIPNRVALPSNFFIIGTVNVDETTYTFSPKVLDRANVLEFFVQRDQFRDFLKSPAALDYSRIDASGASYAEDFVNIASSEPSPLAADELSSVGDLLTLVFDILSENGMSVGFRTAREISRYIGISRTITPSITLPTAIDCQILQRILPKLNGDRRKLRPLLLSLGELSSMSFVWDGGIKNSSEIVKAITSRAAFNGDEIPAEWGESLKSGKAEFPMALNKITRMLIKLKRDGFVNFVEP